MRTKPSTLLPVFSLVLAACVCDPGEPWSASPSSLEFTRTNLDATVTLRGATREQVSLTASVDDDRFQVEAPGSLAPGSSRSIAVRLTAWAPGLSGRLTLTDAAGEARVIRLRTAGAPWTGLEPVETPLTTITSMCPEGPRSVLQLEPGVEFYPTAVRANGEVAVRWRDQLLLVGPDAGTRRFRLRDARYSSLATRGDEIAMLDSLLDGGLVFTQLSSDLRLVRETNLPWPFRIVSPTLLSRNEARQSWFAIVGSSTFELSDATEQVKQVSSSVERTGVTAVELAGATVFPTRVDGGLALAFATDVIATRPVAEDQWDQFAILARSDAGMAVAWRQSGRGVLSFTSFDGVTRRQVEFNTNLHGAVAWTGMEWVAHWASGTPDGGQVVDAVRFDEEGNELRRSRVACGPPAAVWIQSSWAAGRAIVTYGSSSQRPGGLAIAP